jgi:hypothetical protein
MKYTLRAIGLCVIYSGYIMMCVLFLTAYHGKNYLAIVDINAFGEANVEYVIWILIGIPFGTYVVFDTVRMYAVLEGRESAKQKRAKDGTIDRDKT